MNAQDFNWLDRPDDDLLNNAVQQLIWLGALEQQNGQPQSLWNRLLLKPSRQTALTEFGRLVIDLQVGCNCNIQDLCRYHPQICAFSLLCLVNILHSGKQKQGVGIKGEEWRWVWEGDLAMVHPGSTCVEQLELVADGLQLSVCTLPQASLCLYAFRSHWFLWTASAKAC